MEFDRELDARGLLCPLPVLKTKVAIDKLQSGEVLKVVSTDDDEIAVVAARFGAEVHMRDPALGADRVTLDPVIAEAVVAAEEPPDEGLGLDHGIENRLLLGTHFDTRPWPDREEDESLHRVRGVIGACDGGSGTAILLEIATLIGERMPEAPVDIVLFDAEEPLPKEFIPKGYFLGSRNFVVSMSKAAH